MEPSPLSPPHDPTTLRERIDAVLALAALNTAPYAHDYGDALDALVACFPRHFALYHAPNSTFTISRASSYVVVEDGEGGEDTLLSNNPPRKRFMLYTYRYNAERRGWQSYAKGEPHELLKSYCALSPMFATVALNLPTLR